MRFSMLKFLSVSGPALALVLVLSGCGDASERLDRRDERDPLIMRGDARKRAGDVDGAIELYLQALDRKPDLALAHLKLAVEFDEQKRDYLRAIFHYSRYLELRPGARKNELVEELVRMARVSYLASLPNPPPGAIERVAVLERENERLREQIAELTRRVQVAEQRLANAQREATTASRPAPADVRASDPRPQDRSASEAERTYRVERGDTLTRIAAKMYNDHTQWQRIYEANRSQLSTPQSLREGQVLIIP